jgi:hypothetical protein
MSVRLLAYLGRRIGEWPILSSPPRVRRAARGAALNRWLEAAINAAKSALAPSSSGRPARRGTPSRGRHRAQRRAGGHLVDATRYDLSAETVRSTATRCSRAGARHGRVRQAGSSGPSPSPSGPPGHVLGVPTARRWSPRATRQQLPRVRHPDRCQPLRREPAAPVDLGRRGSSPIT